MHVQSVLRLLTKSYGWLHEAHQIETLSRLVTPVPTVSPAPTAHAYQDSLVAYYSLDGAAVNDSLKSQNGAGYSGFGSMPVSLTLMFTRESSRSPEATKSCSASCAVKAAASFRHSLGSGAIAIRKGPSL